MGIMRTVEEVGREEVGAAGMVWYPAIQLTYVNGSLGHHIYSDNNRARVRRNTLIIGPRGARKSSSTKGYMKDYCDMQIAGLDKSKPRMLDMNGMGYERCRGSATMDGDLIQPLFTQADFGYMSEMMTFFEQAGDIAKTANQMNVALEEGHMSVSLVKMFKRYDDAERQDVVDKMARYDVKFDADNCIMYYDVPTSFVACSRPFMEHELKVLEETGLKDRLEDSTWLVSKDGYRKAWRDGPKPPPEAGQDILAFNRKLWDLEWGRVDYPPRPMMDYVIDAYDKFYEHLEDQIGAHPTETRSFRDWSDAAQVVTAFAAMRVAEKWDVDNDGYEIPELIYEDRDATAAAVYAEKMFLQRYVEMSEHAKNDGMLITDRKCILAFLDTQHIDDSFNGPKFVAWFSKKGESMGYRGSGRNAAYEALNRMQDRGWVHAIRYGLYSVDEKIKSSLENGRYLANELVT